MANEIKFVLTVDDKGQIKSVTKDLKSLGAETTRTATAQTKAAGAAHNHFDQQSKGIIGTANSTRSFSKLTQTIGSGSNGLVGAYATLAANVFAVSAAFLVLRDAAQVEQVARGLELMGNRLGITLKIASDNVKEISGGLLTTEQAMRSTAQVIASGFKTEQLERITGVAKNASFALGRDMTESMDRLTRGAIKLEPELLDELGIMVRLDESSQMYARSIGKTVAELTVAEKRQGFMNAVLAEGELKFGGLSDAAGNLTGLTKLQATFKDLTKDILNIVNIAIIPLANLFAASPGALLGAMLIFAGSLKNQLIPGFKDMASQAQKAAVQLKALTQEEAMAAAGTNLRGNAYASLRKEIKDGTVTQQSYLETTSRLTEQLANQEGEAVKRRESGNELGAKSQQKLANATRARILVVKELQAAELLASAETLKANSVHQASLGTIGGFKDAIKSAAEAGNAYGESLRLQQKSVTTLNGQQVMLSSSMTGTSVIAKTLGVSLTGLKVAMFTTAAGAKVLGIALVNAIPIIGQIFFAVSILIDIVKSLYTSFIGKEVLEARKNLNTILDSITAKEKEYIKIQQSSASASQKQASSIDLVSNSLREQIDAVKALSKAEEEKRKDDEALRQGLSKGAPDASTFSQFYSKDDPARKALEAAQKEIAPAANSFTDKGLGKFVSANWDSEIPMIKKQIRSVVDEMDGIEKVSKLSGSGVEKFLKSFDGTVAAGEQTKAVGDSFKQLDNSIKDFAKSATPTTPYDTLVTSLSAVRSNVTTLQRTLGNTKATSEDLAETLSGIGTAAENFITPNSINNLKVFRENAANIVSLQAEMNELPEKSVERGNAEAKVTAALFMQKQLAGNLISSVTEELFAQEAKFKAIQAQSILIEGQISLAQAQVSVLGRYNDLTGEGTKARLLAENNVRNLQASQLTAQAAILDAMNAQSRIKLSLIKAELQSLGINKEQATLDALRIESLRIIELRTQKAAQEQKGISSGGRTYFDNMIKAHTLRVEKLEAAAGLENGIATAEAGAASLRMKASAITMQNVSKTYALAEGVAKADKTALDTAKSALEVAEAKNAADNDSVKTARILNGLEETSLDKLISSRSAIKDLFDLKTAVNNAEKKSKLSELNAARELAKISAPDTADSEAAYKLKEKQIQDEFNANTKKIEAQKTLSILEAAGVKSNVEIAEISKANLDIRKELLDVQSSIVEKQLEGLALDKKIAAAKQGRDLTPIEEWNLTRKAALLKLQTATAEYDLKMSIIKAEYRLLEAKTKIDRLNAIGQIEALAGENKEGTPLFNAYANLIKEFDKLLGYQGTTLQAIIDNGVAKLKTASLDIAAAAVDAAMRKPSTSTVGSALGNSTDVEEVRIDGIKSAKPATGPVVDEQVGQSIFSETAIKKGEELRQTIENYRKEAELASIIPNSQFETLATKLVQSQSSALGMWDAASEYQLDLRTRVDEATIAYIKLLGTGTDAQVNEAMRLLSEAKTAEIAGNFEAMSIRIQAAHMSVQPWIESLKALGPEGNVSATFLEGSFVILEGINRIGQGFDAIKAAAGDFDETMSGLTGLLQGVSAITSQISAIYTASSDAKIANIDREIAAEQKRDGKSAASVAKIAALEKKKEAMAKKQFEVNKKLQLANAVVSTAAAIANALATVPFFPMGPIMAAIAGVAGAAQIAAISSTSFQSASASTAQNTTPSKLSIGSRSSTVDLAKDNKNAGGEVGYLTGSQGQGTNASDFRRAAYGAKTFGNAGYIVGEKGPEMFVPDVPGTINTNDEMKGGGSTTAAFHINTIDATGVEDLLMNQRGNIIGMLREAANASGQPFMEKVNTNMYRPRARKV